MSRLASKPKDDKERYLTYSIIVRAANKDKGIEEEVVTKKMAKFIDGGPKDFLEWVYNFNQLAKLKHCNTEDKILNTTILLEGDLRDAFEEAAFSDDDVRMDEEYTAAPRKASIVVLPVDYSEKLQEDPWEIRKPRDESLAEYSKRFRTLVRQENTLARLNGTSPMCEDALRRLYKRGLPYDWQNKYDASGQVYTMVAALVPFFERIEQGERRLHRAGSHNQRGNGNDNPRHSGTRNNNGNRRSNNSSNNSRQQNQRGGNRGRGQGNNNGSQQGNGHGNSSSSNMYCTFHRTTTHNTQDCRSLRANNRQEEHHQADQQLDSRPARNRLQNHQTRVEQRSQDLGHSSDEEYLFVGLQAKPGPKPPEMRVMIKLESGKERYRALLDSGCSRSIISSEFMHTLQQQGAALENSDVSFELVKGSTQSQGAMAVRFRIPQLKRDSIIIHRFEILPSLADDMTIGRDLMAALGL